MAKKKCFLCEKYGHLLDFNEDIFKKCVIMLAFRKRKNFKYNSVELSSASLEFVGYHTTCYKKVACLKNKYREEFNKFTAEYTGHTDASTTEEEFQQLSPSMASCPAFAEDETSGIEDQSTTSGDFDTITDFASEEIKINPYLLNVKNEPEQTEDDEISIDQEFFTPSIADQTALTTHSNDSESVTWSKVAGRKREAEDPRVQAALDVIQSLGEKRAKKTEKSECALYSEYLASQLEKFDENTRAVVKHEIGNILFQAEMGRYKVHLPSEYGSSSAHSFVSQTSPLLEVNYPGQHQQPQ